MPDAPNAKLFWENILKGHYSIKDVPSDRWDTNLYYHSDPKVPDKTYSKIGSWVTNFEFNPMKMRIPIPPTVLAQMDFTQQWGIAASHQALSDYGYPERTIDPERMAVVINQTPVNDIIDPPCEFFCQSMFRPWSNPNLLETCLQRFNCS